MMLRHLRHVRWTYRNVRMSCCFVCPPSPVCNGLMEHFTARSLLRSCLDMAISIHVGVLGRNQDDVDK